MNQSKSSQFLSGSPTKKSKSSINNSQTSI